MFRSMYAKMGSICASQQMMTYNHTASSTKVYNNVGLCIPCSRCGAGIGMALWILESYVVLLDATDVHNVKGCTVTPPYLDEYREPDPGLRCVCAHMHAMFLNARLPAMETIYHKALLLSPSYLATYVQLQLFCPVALATYNCSRL